jgi:hypothetical protein
VTAWQVFWSLTILAGVATGCLAAWVDVHRECRHQALLDRLWADDGLEQAA